MKSKTYVVAWDEVLENSKNISKQLEDGGHEYTVIDVSIAAPELPNWSRPETVRYYNHFIWALQDFLSTSNDIFVFNAGDIIYEEVSKYTSRVEKIFKSDPNIWLVAPNCTNDHFTNDGVKIKDSEAHPGLYLVTHTNGIWVFMRRPLAEMLHTFLRWAIDTETLDFSQMYSGWGLDTVYCVMTTYNNKKAYRDASVLVSHPKGSSYDHGKANQEYIDTVTAYLDYLALNGENREIASKMCQLVLDKVTKKQNLKLTPLDVYMNIISMLGKI